MYFMNNRSSDSKLWNYWERMYISSIQYHCPCVFT